MAVFENKKQLLMIVGAVAIGVVASVMVAKYTNDQIAEERAKQTQIFEKKQKAAEQKYNEQIADLNKKMIQVEQNAKKAAEDAARLAAAKAAASQPGPTPGGEAAVPKKKPSLALKTPPGKRAVTVKIESLGAVGGLVNPGDFVDIIAHLKMPTKTTKGKKEDESKKDTVTAMIFQKIQILAIDANIDQPGSYDEQQKAPSLRITFAVNPQEASLLAFSEKNGTLELALRGPNESKSVMMSAATWSTLAEYVLENNGADIVSPDGRKAEEPVVTPTATVEVQDVEEAKPYIQIYKGGREL